MHALSRWWIDRRTASRGGRLLREVSAQLTLGQGSRVLELGADGGGLLALVHERYHPARYVGTDFDPVQVEAARKFLTTRFGTLPAAVELRQADALALPFADQSFDCVFAIMMLHHVETRRGSWEKRPQALREVRRVLCPGGLLVYSDIFAREEIRRALADLGFTEVFRRSHWRRDVAIYRAQGPTTVSPPRADGGSAEGP